MPLAHLSPKRVRCRPVRCASSAVGVVAVCASLVAATLAPAGLVAQSRYEVARAGDVVTLSDARTALVVRVTEPITSLLPDPKNVLVKDVILDDIFTDLERDSQGRATVSAFGKTQQLDVVVGPKFKTILVLSRPSNPAGGRGVNGAGAAATPPARRVPDLAFEPMAAVSNGLNLAEKGTYKELQSIAPGGSWEESFWIHPHGF